MRPTHSPDANPYISPQGVNRPAQPQEKFSKKKIGCLALLIAGNIACAIGGYYGIKAIREVRKQERRFNEQLEELEGVRQKYAHDPVRGEEEFQRLWKELQEDKKGTLFE